MSAGVSYHNSLRIVDNQSVGPASLSFLRLNSKFAGDLSWVWVGTGVGLADTGASSKSIGVKQASGSTLVSGSTIRQGFARRSLAFCRGGSRGKTVLTPLVVPAALEASAD